MVSFGMLSIAWRAVLLLALGAGLGLGVNALRSDGIALATFAAPLTCSADSQTTDIAPAVELLSQAQAATLCADPGTQIADARPASAYAEGHVAGAFHLPCSASERTAASAVSGLSTTKLLLVYGERTDDAQAVAEELRRRLGAKGPRIAVLEGGFAAWRDAGFACASGSCGECEATDHHEHSKETP